MRVRFIKGCWIFGLVVLLLGCTMNAQASSTFRQPFKTDTLVPGLVPMPRPDFRRFVQVWVAHGATLTFLANGEALFAERTYTWCGPGVAPPCDSINANGRIRPGYQEKMQFSRISGSVAYGTIIASNFHPKGLAVVVSLQAHDTLLYAGHTSIALLCGPGAPPGECGA